MSVFFNDYERKSSVDIDGIWLGGSDLYGFTSLFYFIYTFLADVYS